MDVQLRPAMIGGTVTLLALGLAWLAIPTAAVPEPRDIGCIYPAERDFARDIYRECGGGAPFLVHEHRVGTLTTRFEFYPGGEWKRITSPTTGGVSVGCIDGDGLPQLRGLVERATWEREPNRSACDTAIAGSEVWQVNGIDKLTYNPCDPMLPDRATSALVDTVIDFEARIAGVRTGPACASDSLVCYEANAGQLFPTAKFVISKTGAWELTKRDVQSEMIDLHATGTLSAAEAADLRGLIAGAPWTLVTSNRACAEYVADEATVTARGITLTWSTCGDMHPDPSTQAAVNRFFALYRSTLRAQPHI